MDQLRFDHPGVQFVQTGEILSRVYGTTFSNGPAPELSAEAFVQQYAGIYGVAPSDLAPGNSFNDQLTQPVMYEPEAGTYKFTLVYYAQQKNGIPVYKAGLNLLVRNETNFPLVLAGSTLRNLGDYEVPAGAVDATPAQLEQTAAQAFNPALSSFSAPQHVIWAGVNGDLATPALAVVFIAEGVNAAGEPLKYELVADATTGEILHSENKILFTDVSGTVSGMATDGFAAEQCNPESAIGLPYARVQISGGNSAYADANGYFTISNAGTAAVTVQSGMTGQYFYVDNVAGSEETLSTSVTPPGPADFLHNAANTSEAVRAQINGYLQANYTRDWMLAQNPSYPTIAGQTNFPVYVNRTDGYCPGNAWYDGVSINFCSSTSTYGNTAFQSVVAHEYGHHAVEVAGSGQDQYGEGMGDCFSLIQADDPRLGVGFYTTNCSSGIRDADNTMQYPCDGEGHACAPLLSGCIWSLRNELAVTEPVNYLDILSNLTVNSILLRVSGDYLIGRSIYTDFLTLDDDNGDLGDGTPHYNEIFAAFDAHNMVPGPPPANDESANAIFACTDTPYTGDTSDATNDGSASCGTSNDSPDVWYLYVPSTNGTLTASLCTGTSYDSAMSIHTGSPGTTANEVACDDDTCGSGGPSQITLGVSAGVTYYIRVTGWSGAAGAYQLNLTGPACDPSFFALSLSFPNGVPDAISAIYPTNIDVQIEDGGEAYVPGSGMLHYRYDGGTWLTAALTAQGGNLYQATLPAANCDDTPEFYITAEGDGGTVISSPGDAPTSTYTPAVGAYAVAIDDNFETNLGWTATSSGATSGYWQRGVPVNASDWDYDPASDADGSGQCYLTENATGNTDVDNGSVTLTSPTLDLSSGGVTIAYDYFLRLTDTDGSDRLLVEIDGNAGAGPWTQIALHSTDGGLSWRHNEITQTDLDNAGVTLTATMRVRFTANDGGTQSIVEAGVDGLLISTINCFDGYQIGDLNCDGVIDLFDIDAFVLALTSASDPTPFESYFLNYPDCDPTLADVNDDGAVDLFDIDPFVGLIVP